MAYRETLVVVGNGMVGFKLCQELVDARAHNRYHIVVFGEETRPAYDRVHVGDLLSGRTEEDLLLVPARWYAEHGIELHLGDRVAFVDRQSRTVQSSKGEQLLYDWLVLATGSSPFIPAIEGADLPGVFTARTVSDLQAILAYCQSAESVAVVGGGLLGLETARALRDLHLDVSVIELASGLMSRQLDQGASELLRAKVEALGVRILLEKKIERIAATDTKRVVHFDDTDSVAVDVVIFSAGIIPRDELARACGVECAPNGGVKVDERMLTSDERIFAVGECASYQGVTYGLVAPGYKMAEVVASNLVDRESQFKGAESSTRLKLVGINVAAMGNTRIVGDTRSFQNENVYRKLIIDDNKIVGAIAVGTWPSVNRVQAALTARRSLTTSQVNRFDATGSLWPRQSGLPVARWPQKMIVCQCFNITRGDLAEAYGSGCHTVEALARRTGASTGCGSCKALLVEYVGAEPAAAVIANGGRPLLVAAAAAALLGAAVLALGPLPQATSVTQRLASLWSDRALKLVTGYGLLVPVALSLLLSLRKRWRRVTIGEFATWRLAHGVLGAVALLLLVLHTGLSLGQHVNRVLMADFLAMSVLGSVAATATVLDHRLPAKRAKVVRTLCNRAHIALFWPFPVLVAFHVFVVYYF